MKPLVSITRAQLAPQLTDVSVELLAALIAAATELIERYCGREFSYETVTDEMYSGDGTQELLLRRFPVASLTTITIVDSAGNETDYASATYFRVDLDSGIVQWRPDQYCTFPVGFENIKATYVGGYQRVPADLQSACVQIVEALVGIESSDARLTQEKLGDYARTFRVHGEDASPIFSPGVQSLLSAYVDERGGDS